jgi:hypothetical protein
MPPDRSSLSVVAMVDLSADDKPVVGRTIDGDGSEPGTPGREQALVGLKKRRELQSHVVVYVVFNTAMWLLWATTGQGYPWPAWVTACWAVGLVTNAWDVYFRRPITEQDIQRELARLDRPR